MSDERMGQKVVAFIEPKNGCVDKEALIRIVLTQRWLDLNGLDNMYLQNLPKSASGKLLRRR